ncbi:MAG: hypothetical protein ACT6T3_22150, partial [Agrobacterium sp.]|uniref:hypothetical protein n=1 Tax=Agrobacterium sp. TaxID=361 RepID=UPI0040347A46
TEVLSTMCIIWGSMGLNLATWLAFLSHLLQAVPAVVFVMLGELSAAPAGSTDLQLHGSRGCGP